MTDKILNSFDTWINAQGLKSKGRVKSVDNISLEGIARLRELILDLAVRGKLVAQNPSDEPASVLLENMLEARDKLIEQGILSKQKQLPELSKYEIPANLPKNWVCVRLGQISEVERGGSPRPIKSYLTSDNDGLNWIKIGDTEKGGKYIESTAEKIRKEGLIKTRKVFPGDFLLTNSMSFGRPYITKIEGCIHDGWLRIHPPDSINKDFLYHLLSSNFVKSFFKKHAAGAVVKNLNSAKVRELPILIPPIQEQKRIVTKVDELMELCDDLEQQAADHLKSRQLLVETLLATLTDATNPKELAQAWSRLETHFDDLFITEDSIDQLKQTILQLAVMGKLVPQNVQDEATSELLNKITAQKENLIKEGKLKKQKPLPEIGDEEKSFELPAGWEWVRLGNITNKIGSGSTPRGGKEAYVEEGNLFLRSQNIYNHGLLLDDVAFIDDETHEKMSNTKVLKNDILLNITGGSLGRVALFPEDISEANVSQHVSIIRPTNPQTKHYIHLWLLAPYGQNLIWGRQVGANREGLSKKVLELFEVPLPPLQEQHRILEKVNQLFKVCNSLNDKIKHNQEVANNIAHSVLEFID